jgi:tRNA (cytidine/uridine-2'-O-)-methyltransferase
MLHVVLHEPEIPPNAGNIMRLCVNTATKLHLIEPLGFDLDDTKLRRAGLDYRDLANVSVQASLEAFAESFPHHRIVACSTRGDVLYSDVAFTQGDALLFGRESRGLDSEVLSSPLISEVVRIPMAPDSRSLNVANAVAVVLYEALRQLGYPGLS